MLKSDLAAHTPMMAQHLRIEAEHPDVLVLDRMGDFHEPFYDDARKANRLHDGNCDAGRPAGRANDR